MASPDVQPLPPALVLDELPFDPTARRVEIDEFIYDNVITNLFFLALEDMKNVKNFKGVKDDDWFSFYNLSLIHGFPLENWRGVKNTTWADRIGTAGRPEYDGYYCTHGSTVFPTWHRLYIHMFEQAVFQKMTNIAASFTSPEQAKLHQEALKRFRMPYWDPCLPRLKLTKPRDLDTNGSVKTASVYKMFDMPHILRVDHVWVVRPDGAIGQIANPLLSFEFPSKEQYAVTGRQHIDWENTSGLSSSIPDIESLGYEKVTRTPGLTGKPNEDLFTFAMRNKFSDLSLALFQLLHPDLNKTEHKWSQFANHLIPPAPGDSKEPGRWPINMSLESWHDDVHDLCGAGLSTGHMGVVPVAAFDPIFWLHHNNIDRIFALWQSLYHTKDSQNTFVPDKPEGIEKLVATSQLAPFVKEQIGDSQKCYNSKDVESWTNLGYAIPGDKPVDEQGRAAIQQYITNVYSWQDNNQLPPEQLQYPKDVQRVFAISGKNFENPSLKIQFLGLVDNQIVAQTYGAHGEERAPPEPTEALVENSDDWTTFPKGTFINRDEMLMNSWTVLVKVKKYAFKSTFKVTLFIGTDEEIPSNGQELFTTSTSIGSTSIFAFRPDAACENCTQRSDLEYSTVIPITPGVRDCLKSNESKDKKWPPKRLRTLETLKAKDVVPFLTKELKWRISMANGDIVSKEEVEASELQLLVAHREYQYPDAIAKEQHPMGIYGELEMHPEVTQGRPGGYRSY